MIIDFPLGATSKALSTIAALKALNSHSDGDQVQIAGYYAPGDGGGGSFYYDASSSTTDNGGTVIAPTAGSGRWKRIWDQERANISWFGVFPDLVANQTALMQVAIDALSTSGALIHIPSGTFRVRNLLIRNKTRIIGSGPSTILTLLDGSVVADHVLKCGSTVSGIDNVYIGHLTLDGNATVIGLSDVSMHGIKIEGDHKNWTIEHVYAQNTCGDGITVYAPNADTIDNDIHISNVHCAGCRRQDISLVRASGVTIADCSGTGTFDIEANTGDGAKLKNIVVTNARFNIIAITGRGAESGGFIPNNISAVGLYATTRVLLWQTANASLSGIVCGGEVSVSECDRVNITGVVAKNAVITAPNNTAIRNCLFSNFQLSCSTNDTPALNVSNAIDCTFSGFDIKGTGTNGDGIQITNSTAQAASTLLFRNFTISHTRYGVNAITTLFQNTTVKLIGIIILNEGTKALRASTGPTVSYGKFIINQCDIYGGIAISRFNSVVIEDVKINGNYTIASTLSDGALISIDNVKIIRTSAGTPAIALNDNTNIALLKIGVVEQVGVGGFTVTFTNSTFASTIKAWINGPVVEATTWASGIADANIKEGSMYRLRGNTTNYAYTHNGTAWVAKAH